MNPVRARAVTGALALAIVTAAGGCTAHAPPPDDSLTGLEDPAATPAGPPQGAAAPAPAPASRRRSGAIARASLDRVLHAGPGAFLATVEVRAHLVAGSFAGWEVVRTPYPDVDLVPGDVVLSVNGHTLEHPLDLQALWRELAAAGAIRVEVARGDRRFALAFQIVPAPAAPAPRVKVAP